jgi:hypothetical protein
MKTRSRYIIYLEKVLVYMPSMVPWCQSHGKVYTHTPCHLEEFVDHPFFFLLFQKIALCHTKSKVSHHKNVINTSSIQNISKNKAFYIFHKFSWSSCFQKLWVSFLTNTNINNGNKWNLEKVNKYTTPSSHQLTLVWVNAVKGYDIK